MTRAVRALAVSLLAGACVTAAPPPSAPAPATPGSPIPSPPAQVQPGFRAVTPQGVELVFDAKRRTYAVANRPDVFWLEGRFFRQESGGWQTSARVDGPWQPCPFAELPEGLR